ncbi:type 4a pilus biogenesis protein PilO [Kineococcus sp. SYSU DK004]|uniref:type 4a pilus biogenesis protein PilO n=1 Tax=Kineococcus sp. SYSU DK004 TaxID=3383125 RepID=UPI003D7DA304
MSTAKAGPASKNTLWIAGTGVLALLVLVATYFLLVAPQRTEAANLATQTAQVQQSNAALEQQTALLASQAQSLDEKKLDLARIVETLPAQAELPSLLRTLDGFSAETGVVVTSVAPGTPSAYGAAAAGSSPISRVPLAVTVEGSFAAAELYVKKLQADMGRFFLVTDLEVTAGSTEDASGVTATVTGDLFVVTDLTAAAGVSAGPAGAAAPAPAATSTDDGLSSSTESVS